MNVFQKAAFSMLAQLAYEESARPPPKIVSMGDSIVMYGDTKRKLTKAEKKRNKKTSEAICK